ncbi:MAG: glycosyltransferase family 2 protein [Planctomycetota bacterium]|jgi:GT2 family glycosyltransferase|nr:glycosyltransferase family 2 protein [Planctomycetota bacterium]
MREDSCAAVIVAYNNEDGIADCLASLFAHSRLKTTAVVVDNSPGEGTADAVLAYRDAHPDQDIGLIRRPDNIGFAAGCNLGAKGGTGKYLLFLNPDASLENDAPSLLAAFLRENPRAKIAGPQIRDRRGAVGKTCRNLPTPLGIFFDAAGLDRYLGYYRLTRFDHAHARKVGQIIGACMFIRREDFEALGGFDERFFIYYEEVDLCKRVWDSGGEVWFYPGARIGHVGGVSCEAPAAVNRMPGFLRRSRAHYFAKYYGLAPQFLVLGVSIGESLCKAAVLTVLAWLGKRDSAARLGRRNGFIALLREWARKG